VSHPKVTPLNDGAQGSAGRPIVACRVLAASRVGGQLAPKPRPTRQVCLATCDPTRNLAICPDGGPGPPNIGLRGFMRTQVFLPGSCDWNRRPRNRRTASPSQAKTRARTWFRTSFVSSSAETREPGSPAQRTRFVTHTDTRTRSKPRYGPFGAPETRAVSWFASSRTRLVTPNPRKHRSNQVREVKPFAPPRGRGEPEETRARGR